jgi:Icc-related predicted phosphoesterase
VKFWKKGTAAGDASRIFFAADFHGSETTFRKFLASARKYEVDALVFGGDLMGKALVPLVHVGQDEWRVYEPNGQRTVKGSESLAEIKSNFLTLGYYWWQGEQDEYDEIRNDVGAVERLFDEMAARRLENWLQLADDRLRGTSVRMFLTGGNDDTDAFLRVLDDARLENVISCDDKVVSLDERHE